MEESKLQKRFRVALSFAGEKREFVRKVAEKLAEKLGRDKVLFDKWYEAEFARADLGNYLPDLYRREADLVVAFHCGHYEQKNWCGAEWTAIQTYIHAKRPEAVMLCRFDRTAKVPGIYETAGFVDIEDESDHRAGEVAALILKRLPAPGIAVPEGKFVYVCEPAGELESEHVRLVNDLKTELNDLGISVVATEFRKKPELVSSIPELLAAASFVVQLHGMHPVPAPYDSFGASIEYWLAEQLRRLCMPVQNDPDRPPNKVPGRTWLRWRSDALKPDHITDPTHRAFVFDDDHHVYALPEVKFREFVVQTIERELQNEKLPEISVSKVLIRSSAGDAPATGDLCDRIDMFSTGAGTRPLSAEIVLNDVALETYCDAFRKKGLRPGGLFVVYELSPDPGEEWVNAAMRECRAVALKYKPTLPVCVVYASKAQDDKPRLLSVPGRFRVVWYQPQNGGNEPGPLDPDALNKALRDAQEVQR